MREYLTNGFCAPVAAIAAAGFLCGCSTVLSKPPAASEEFVGDYRQLADCVYVEIETAAGIRSIHKRYDSPSTKRVLIAAEWDSVRYWELVIAETGPDKVSAGVTPFITHGPDKFPSDNIMPTVRKCASSEPG